MTRRGKLSDLSRHINAASIGGGDAPHEVVEKLQRAIDASTPVDNTWHPDNSGALPGAGESFYGESYLRSAVSETAPLVAGDLKTQREIHDSYAPSARVRSMYDAPKDGTPVLGWVPTYYRGKGAWVVVLWLEEKGMREAGWMDNRAFQTTPTHWMPLPEAPHV